MSLSDKKTKVIDLPREGMFQRDVIPTEDVKEGVEKLKEVVEDSEDDNWLINIRYGINKIFGKELSK